MKIEKIYSITIAKELDILYQQPARTEIIIQNPEGISINVEAGECRGGRGNVILKMFHIDPQELFGDGVTVIANVLIDPEDGGELFNDEVTLFPQFDINLGGGI